jgi:biopolymer transport protein ExbD
MNFAGPIRARSAQDRSIVPMINVVFLLLIFFLMTASLAPPPPMDIAAPVADAPPTDRLPGTLYVASDGSLVFGNATGEAALAALQGTASPLPVMADARLAAADLATLLRRLAGVGVTDIALRTLTP